MDVPILQISTLRLQEGRGLLIEWVTKGMANPGPLREGADSKPRVSLACVFFLPMF